MEHPHIYNARTKHRFWLWVLMNIITLTWIRLWRPRATTQCHSNDSWQSDVHFLKWRRGLNLEQSYPATSTGPQASSAIQGHPCRRTHGRTVKPAPGLCQLKGHHTWCTHTYRWLPHKLLHTRIQSLGWSSVEDWTWCYDEACVLQTMVKPKCINAQAQSWNSHFH